MLGISDSKCLDLLIKKTVFNYKYIQNMINVEKLSEAELDLLREIGNIGCAHAATAISGLIKKKIDISIPKIDIKNKEDLIRVLHGSDKSLGEPGENKVVAIYLELTKDFIGSILFIFPAKSALALADTLMQRPVGTVKEIGEDEKSALMEVGNIVVSAYANALGEFLDCRVMLTPPTFTYKVPEGVMESINKIVDQENSHAVIFNTQLSENNKSFKSFFILLPSPASLESLIKKLLK